MSQSLIITPRDIQILLFTYQYDGVIIDIIRRRFWGANSRTPCYDRVARLTRAHYLRQRRLPPQSQQGTGKAWITVGPAALPLLTEHLGLTSTERRRIRHSFSPLHWEHAIAVRELRLEFQLACDRSGLFETTEWISEETFKNEPLRVADPTMAALIPDGAIVFALSKRPPRTFYAELDRSTIASPKRMRDRFRAYMLADQTGPHPLLMVAPTQARVDQLRRWAHEAAGSTLSPRSLWFTNWERLTEQDLLLDPVWQTTDGSDVALITQLIATKPKPKPAPPELHETDISLQ